MYCERAKEAIAKLAYAHFEQIQYTCGFVAWQNKRFDFFCIIIVNLEKRGYLGGDIVLKSVFIWYSSHMSEGEIKDKGKERAVFDAPKVDLRRVFQGSFTESFDYDESEEPFVPLQGEPKGLVSAEDELMIDNGSHQDLSCEFVRVDLTTELERNLSYISFGCSLCAMWMYFVSVVPQISTIETLALIALVSILVRLTVDCTYVLDNTRGFLLYSRSIFGITSNFTIASFHEIEKIGISKKNPMSRRRRGVQRNFYVVVAKLSNGAVVELSDFVGIRGLALSFGRRLSEHLNVEFVLPDGEHSYLTVTEDVPMTESTISWKTPSIVGYPGYWEWILLISALLSMYVGYF